MVKNGAKALNIIITIILLISLIAFSSLIILKVFKRTSVEMTSTIETFSERELIKELSSISIIHANKTGFSIKNTGRVTIKDLKVFADNVSIEINSTYCKKICLNCSRSLNVLEPDSELYCNISLSGYKILTVVSKYAKDWRVIE